MSTFRVNAGSVIDAGAMVGVDGGAAEADLGDLGAESGERRRQRCLTARIRQPIDQAVVSPGISFINSIVPP